jgi:hypothetical protein
MLLIYTSILAALVALRTLVKARAARLEKRFVRAAYDADESLKLATARSGNGKVDVAAQAKHQYLLGAKVQKRDALEVRWQRWANWADALTRRVRGLAGWKGRLLPYALGGLDVWLLMNLAERLGHGHLADAGVLARTVMALFVR